MRGAPAAPAAAGGWWPVIAAGIAYYALAFGAGFVLGTARVLLLVPRIGERTAELLEMPVMLVVVIIAARFVTRHFALAPTAFASLAVGALAVALLVATELTVVLAVRGTTLADYLDTRDPVAGLVYVALLGCFALMPLLVRPRDRVRRSG
ncbi:MAG: hypothetical protein ABI593_00930 [Betaproteobacteria bacterium]